MEDARQGETPPSARNDTKASTVSHLTLSVSVVLALIGFLALAAAWFANGKGMKWRLGPETMVQVHQASTHFPIGLLLSSVAFELAALLFRREDLRATAFWTLLAGAASAVGSAVVGLLGNPFAGDTSALGLKVLLHQKVGLVTAVVFVLLALWRVARQGRTGKAEGALLALVTLAGVILVTVTGYLGGHLMD